MNTTITGLQTALQMNAKKAGFDEPEDFRQSLRFQLARSVEENRKLREQLEERKKRIEFFFLTILSSVLFPPLIPLSILEHSKLILPI